MSPYILDIFRITNKNIFSRYWFSFDHDILIADSCSLWLIIFIGFIQCAWTHRCIKHAQRYRCYYIIIIVANFAISILILTLKQRNFYLPSTPKCCCCCHLKKYLECLSADTPEIINFRRKWLSFIYHAFAIRSQKRIVT